MGKEESVTVFLIENMFLQKLKFCIGVSSSQRGLKLGFPEF